MREKTVSSPAAKSLRARLLQWYDKQKRELPWREDPSPYHVWISEIMLQQTRVEAVRGYYARFLAALPDIASLAAAEEDVCLKLWEGLGYYSRVRNLRRAAVQIVQDYGGRMPQTAEELKRLPGIGPYTAAAIASIAFGEAVPAVDGNLLRIFARMTVWDGLAEEGKTKTAAEAFFLDIFYGRTPARPGLSAKEGEDLPAGRAHRPGDCNQALMDLGATVCLPNAKPRCEACPWAGDCLAHAEKKETAYPLRAAKKERQAEDRTILLVLSASRALLHKRPAKGLLAGLYEFPNLPGHLSSEEVREWVRAAGFSPLRIRRLPEAKHIFTHKEWRMIGYEVRVDELQTAQVEEKGTLSARKEDGFFLTDRSDLRERYSLPSAFRTYTDHFDALSRKMEEKQR